MIETVFSKTDERGREFVLQADFKAIESDLLHLIDVNPDDEEYGINHVVKGEPSGNDRWTYIERKDDEDALLAVSRFNYLDWEAIFNNIAKKKDGTLAKNRVHVIHRANTFAQYWEESYGWNAPEIRVKSIDDFTATVTLQFITEHY